MIETPELVQGDQHALDRLASDQDHGRTVHQSAEIGVEVFDRSPNPKLYIMGRLIRQSDFLT